MKETVLKVSLLLLISALTTQADVLVEWDIAGVNGPNDSDATAMNIAQGLSATTLTAAGVTPISTESWNHGDNDYPGSFAASGWDVGSYAANKYYTFSVSAEVATSVSIEGISLSLTHGVHGGTGATNWVLRTSQDGFASDIETYSTAAYAIDEQVHFDSVFESALSLQGGASIEFRLYGYYPGSSSDYSGLANMENGSYGSDEITGTGSNVVLYGTIPEPMAVGLFGFAAVGALLVRRIFLV